MPRSHRALLLGLLVLVTATAFEAQAVTTAMPAAASDLGRLDLYAWAFTAFWIPQIVAVVAAGRWCDRVGPVGPLIAGTAVSALGVVVSASAPTMTLLLVGRFTQGIAAGLLNLALMVLVGRVYEPSDRARVMTWFSAAWMLPSFVGPAAAAWLAENLSWHWVFWAVLPAFALGAGLLFPPLLRLDIESNHEDAAPAGLWPAVAVALAAAVLQVAGQAASAWSVGLAVVGVVLLVVGAPRLMPVGYRPLAPGLSAVVGVRLLGNGTFAAALSFLPLMLVQVGGLSLTQAGVIVTISSVGWMLGSWLQSQPWVTMRRDTMMTVGLGCVTGAVIALALATVLPSALWAGALAGGVLAGVGMGLASTSTAIAVMQLSPAAQLGRNTSALQVAETMGVALLTGLAGSLFAWWHGRGALTAAFGVPFAVLIGTALAGLALSRRIGPVANHSARSGEPLDLDRPPG